MRLLPGDGPSLPSEINVLPNVARFLPTVIGFLPDAGCILPVGLPRLLDEMDALPEGMGYLRCIVLSPFRVFIVLRPMQWIFQNVLPDRFIGIVVADDVFEMITLPYRFAWRVARCVDARGDR